MSDNVTLFPHILQPTVALKAYAPLGVKFWENQQTGLEGFKEFSDGWFARRQKSTLAALETTRNVSNASTLVDIVREYQNWFTAAMEVFTEDSKAYQQQMLRTGVHLNATPEAQQTAERRTG